MRVATQSFYKGIQQNLLRLSWNLERVNEKITSGKKINRPSDDPIAAMDSLGLRTALSQMEQYSRNIGVGRSWLTLSESSLTQILDLVTRAKEIAIQMSNDSQNSETRASTAFEVGHLLDQAVALGNTKLGNSYIFAGYQTHTSPFSKVTVGDIETSQYLGDTNNFQIQIGDNETLTAGKNGQNVLMDSNLFNTLGNLKKALEDNNVSRVRQQLNALDGVDTYLNNQIADVGAKSNRLEGKENVLADLNLHFKDRLSQVEDVDLAEITLELKEKELAYQAALQASASISQLSLMDYLR